MFNSISHSVEILSAPDSADCIASPTSAIGQQDSMQVHKFTSRNHHHLHQNTASTHATSSSSPNTPSTKLTKSSNSNCTPNLPATYVALYPYKPQKSDELELKKGCK